MSKKISAFLLALCMVIALSAPAAAAADDIGITIDGSSVAFTSDSGSPFIDSHDRTLVPLRVTMETYGCEVFWDNENRSAVVYKDGVTVVCPIGDSSITVNGESVAIDTAAVIVESRTYLPIRCVLEAVGADVNWDANTRTVVVKSGEADVLLHQDSYISLAEAAIAANVNLSAQDAEDVKSATVMFLQNVSVDQTQINKMCVRLKNLVLNQAALDGAVGYCETYDNVNFTITMDSTDPEKLPTKEDYMEILFHELCHMFSNMQNTHTWFKEGMTSMLTASIAGNGTWELYSYDVYLRLVCCLMEFFGKDVMLNAYLTGDESALCFLLNSYAGVSNASTVLDSSAEQMTDALVSGMFTWLDTYDGMTYEEGKALYDQAAAPLIELLKKAWQGKYGEASENNPLISAYLDLLGRYTFVTTARIISDPAFMTGTTYNYYGLSTYKSFFVLNDRSNRYCYDGELVYYRYAS
jgi:hypothetical protein